MRTSALIQPVRSLADHILSTFHKRWPTLRADPVELAARLARRKNVQLNRPPRAHCIPLRASDTRLNPQNVSCVLRTEYDAQLAHTVMLYADELRPLLELIQLDPGGESWLRVADRLGTHENNLRYLMNKGFFRVERVAGYGGKPGKPTPFLHYDGWLDPCSRSFRPPDAVWGGLHHYRATALPDDFEQHLRREPLITRGRWGTDFMGWQWVCPLCEQRTDRVYFPMPVPNVETYLRIDIPALANDPTATPPQPKAVFACKNCHKISFTTRGDKNGWNDLVTYLTCGLLYGHEVEKPTWWHVRKNTYSPRPNAKPVTRRYQVRDLLTETILTREEIAKKLRLSRGTINMHIEDLYKEYNVHSRESLKKRAKLQGKVEAGNVPAMRLAE